MEGSGKMVVTAVGVNSQAGIIFTLLGAAVDEQEKAAKQSKGKHKKGSNATAGDIEQGLTAAAAGGSNSHPGPAAAPVRPAGTAGPAPGPPPAAQSPNEGKALSDEAPEHVSTKKEKSVLQAKLTKLAIQIGYAGAWSLSLKNHSWL